MACLVPGCGATFGLHFHHEAPAGWRDVGDDPDRVSSLCSARHRQRHEGWLTIEGTGSTGFRFYRHGGVEIVAPRATSAPKTAAPTTERPKVAAHVGNPGSSGVDAVAELTLRALELGKTAARAAIQRAWAQATVQLTVAELVSLALRGLPAG